MQGLQSKLFWIPIFQFSSLVLACVGFRLIFLLQLNDSARTASAVSKLQWRRLGLQFSLPWQLVFGRSCNSALAALVVGAMFL